MVDLTDLDGVGPARSGYLTEAGYGDFETIADADNETLAEDVDIPEDTALELIVQSQNIVAERDAEVEEDEPDTITDEIEEELEDEDEETEVEESEDDADAGEDEEPADEDEPIVFSIEFEGALEYDTFFDSVMQQRMKMFRTNRTDVEAFDHALDQMREGGTDESVDLRMDHSQLNDLHSSISQMLIQYKGDNLIDHMDALQQVMNQIDEVRSEHLF